jgi:hypothetical protein
MKIAEVADHIGEEWLVGGYRTHTGRGRIDGIETVEETGYGYHRQTRKVRYVHVTFLDSETGEPRILGARQVIGLVEAKDLVEPWTDYWEREARARAIRQRETDVLTRLERLLGEPIPSRYSLGGHKVILPIEQAEKLAELIEAAHFELHEGS